MVLSFEKTQGPGQPVVLNNFNSFTKGFEHAVLKGTRFAGNLIRGTRDLKDAGYAGHEYQLQIGSQLGVARLYEAPRHYYAALVLGETYAQPEAEQFLKSFKLNIPRPEANKNEDPNLALLSMEPPVPVSTTPATPEQGPWPLYEPHPSGRIRAPIAFGILNGKAISKPEPVYPPIALAARASGTVVVAILADESGKVISAKAASGHPLLQEAAVQAAYQARFPPTRVEGQPVKIAGTLTYQFVLKAKP
jgi:TonB family protein